MAALDGPDIVVEAIVDACIDPQQERPVGTKARSAKASHRLFRELTERFSGMLSESESESEIEKGSAVPDTSGALYEPVAGAPPSTVSPASGW